MPQTETRIQQLAYRDLCNLASRWNEDWIRKGCPSDLHMARGMLKRKDRLMREFARRGVQLRLFEPADYA